MANNLFFTNLLDLCEVALNAGLLDESHQKRNRDLFPSNICPKVGLFGDVVKRLGNFFCGEFSHGYFHSNNVRDFFGKIKSQRFAEVLSVITNVSDNGSQPTGENL